MGNCSNGHKLPKKKPYGSTRGIYWCGGCDAELVPSSFGPRPKPIKKTERQKAKKEIERELKNVRRK